MLGLSTVLEMCCVEAKEGRDGVEEGNGVPCDAVALSSRTKARSEHGCVPVREDQGARGSGGSVEETTGQAAAQDKEKAMRGALEGQEGAYLICDGVNVLIGVERGLEGHTGGTGNL